MPCILLACVVFTTAPPLQGDVNVPRLGTIALPPGKWFIEHDRPSPDGKFRPDIFVFRRQDRRMERITVIRYSHEAAAAIAQNVFDSMWNGIPDELAIVRPDSGETATVHVDFKRLPIKITVVNQSDEHDPWLVHANAFDLKASGTIVWVHSSPLAISPMIIDDVAGRSKISSLPKP